MAPSGDLLPDWGHYDEVAEGYARFLAVNGYAALAANLIGAADVFLYGRVVRCTLDPVRWRAFKFSVAKKVHSHGVTRVEYTARFHVGVGTRP